MVAVGASSSNESSSNKLNSATELSGFDFEELKFAHGQLVALENAARSQCVRFVHEMMDRDEWHRDTCGGFERWLCQQFQFSRKLALEIVAVAGRFAELPLVMRRFSNGALSWDQTVAICEFASPDDEEAVVASAETMTLEECRATARRHRLKKPDEKPWLKRKATMSWSRSGDTFKLSASFDAISGAVVERALNHAMDVQYATSANPELRYPQRLAQAVVDVCSTNITHGMEAPRPTVVVHVDAGVLAGVENGVAEIENGPSVDHMVAQRLACDGKVQLVFDGTDGKPVGIGRTSRRVPHWLARQLNHRDGGCRFPGCGSNVFLHFHHIDQWVRDKGHTNLDRMVTLCARHHHFIHEFDWKIRGRPDDFEFIDQNDNIYEGRRPVMTSHTQEVFNELVGDLVEARAS